MTVTRRVLVIVAACLFGANWLTCSAAHPLEEFEVPLGSLTNDDNGDTAYGEFVPARVYKRAADDSDDDDDDDQPMGTFSVPLERARRSCLETGLTAKQKEEIIQVHNKYRGMVEPHAADMTNVVS